MIYIKQQRNRINYSSNTILLNDAHHDILNELANINF